MMRTYAEFIKSKEFADVTCGFDSVTDTEINPTLFPFQRALVEWALKKGRAAIFADTGLGKSFCQLAWADAVVKRINRPALILAPLAVAQQTVGEARKMDIEAQYLRDPLLKSTDIVITNYEMADRFDFSDFGAIVLSPFAGIGSEGYVSLKRGRRFIGVELKRSYYDLAVKNLTEAADAGIEEALL